MRMTCRDVRPVIESLASGEQSPTAPVAAHLAECRACSDALSLAARIDQFLASPPETDVPLNFASSVLRRVRRDWWRTEQHLDRWFNVMVGCGLLLVSAGVWMLINLSGLTALTFDASGLLVSGLRALTARVVPALPIYGTAAAILVSAFGLWWWAERGWTG